MIIKVCGVRTGEVARTAIAAGADWIGLVFEPRSPRHVDDAAADAVIRAVAGRVDLIGVLVEPSVERCEQLAARFALAAFQVHGDVAPALVQQSPLPLFGALNVRAPEHAYRTAWPLGLPLFLDAPPPRPGALPGGTGRTLSWPMAAAVARHRPIMLSGGLRPDTVAGAIREVRPHGVDASSGLERAPGEKDPGLVRAFVHNARVAFAQLDGSPTHPHRLPAHVRSH